MSLSELNDRHVYQSEHLQVVEVKPQSGGTKTFRQKNAAKPSCRSEQVADMLEVRKMN